VLEAKAVLVVPASALGESLLAKWAQWLKASQMRWGDNAELSMQRKFC